MKEQLEFGLFAQNRERFFEKMKDGIAVLIGSRVKARNSDTTYPFRQNSDFYYLTGFEEPNSFAFLIKEKNEKKFVMLVPRRDRSLEVWTGYRAGVKGAKEIYGADEAFEIYSERTFPKKLEEFINNKQRVYYPLGFDEKTDEIFISVLSKLRKMSRMGKNAPDSIHDTRGILHEMRMIKTAREIEFIENAVEITKRGFIRAMKETRIGLAEFQVQAMLEYEYRRLGSMRDGFEHIVASGANSCILHYVNNRKKIEKDDLILIDSGAEYKYFSADVTRTFPGGTKFTEPQRKVYNIVLAAADRSIKLSKPGANLNELHDAASEIIRKGLIEIGVFPFNSKEEIEKEKLEKRYYMHKTSHWLGMDVHDVGKYKIDKDTHIPLTAGHVFTVEPGIYFPYDDLRVPKEYRGIGIRIEDDILITEEGNRNLSYSIPRTIKDIEALLAE